MLAGLWTEDQDAVFSPSFDPDTKVYELELPITKSYVDVTVSKPSGIRWGNAVFVSPNKNNKGCLVDYFAGDGSFLANTAPPSLERMQSYDQLSFRANFSQGNASNAARAVMTLNVNNGFITNSYTVNILRVS